MLSETAVYGTNRNVDPNRIDTPSWSVPKPVP